MGHVINRLARVVLASCVVVGGMGLASARGYAAPAKAAASAGASGSAAFDWPELHQNPQLGGYAANSTLSTANASRLGVTWAADLYSAALDSPVVAYNANLGKTLAYVGTEHGDLVAINTATGQIQWSRWLGGAIRSTPIVTGGAVFAGTDDSPIIYKLDATTGAVDCSVPAPEPIEGTFVAATPPGGKATVYVGTNDSSSAPGPVLAVSQSDCSIEWSFTGYATMSGSWVPVSYVITASGEPVIVFGSADPDSGMYSVDAVTGNEVWRFAPSNPSPGVYDIGAGAAITPPGVNGFADGMVYVPSKRGLLYALDLSTGNQVWNYNFNPAGSNGDMGRSTPAVDGTNVVFGTSTGLADVNAVNGSAIWNYNDPANIESISSPAIAGASGSEIVATGDLAGGFDVASLATGSQLYHYQTHGYVTASPAVSGGSLLIASSDGFLYNFGVGGGNDSTLPSTTISAPADSSTLANPNGSVSLTGTATDPVGVASVEVAVQSGGPDGQWWNGSSWSPGPAAVPAALSAAGATSSSWSLSLPIPPGGGTYSVTAYATSSSGQSDVNGGHTTFSVQASTKGPHIKVNAAYVAPAQNLVVNGGGFGPSEQVSFTMAGSQLASATTTSTGSIPATTIKVPSNEPFGLTSLVAAGATSGRSTSIGLTVANSWAQQGYGAGRDGLEPNDATLMHLVHPGGNTFVDPAWQYHATAAIASAPVVADGRAYLADTAGRLTAIDIHNGAPVWSWHVPSGQAIHGAPAVDPHLGLVFVGSDDGTLTAVSASSGATVWTATPGGGVFSPAVAGNQVFAASSTGTLAAYTESSGAQAWSVTLSSVPDAGPAVDAGHGNVILSSGDGSVTAVSTTSGARRWAFATGGAVSSPAAIYAGVVYAGSADDSVYAISESTGAKVWSSVTGGPVTGTPVVTNEGTYGNIPTEVLAGSADHNLYALKASDGSVAFTQAFPGPIAGLAACRGVVIINTTDGSLGASRTYTNLKLWDYGTGSQFASPPIVVDGAVYAAAANGSLYAFTSFGQPPS